MSHPMTSETKSDPLKADSSASTGEAGKLDMKSFSQSEHELKQVVSCSLETRSMKAKARKVPSEVSGTKKPLAEERRKNWRKRRPRRKNVRKPKTQAPGTIGPEANGPEAIGLQEEGQPKEWEGEKTPVNQSPLNVKQEQERRASWVRQRMIKYGKPFAPYNTTQFLMEDQTERDPEVIGSLESMETEKEVERKRSRNESFSTRDGSESDEYYSSPDDEQDFQSRQFSQVYELIHAERISNMSKRDLVQEFLLLEEKMEQMEKQLSEAKRSKTSDGSKDDEVTNLRQEVSQLKQENQKLRGLLSLPSRPFSSDTSVPTS